MIEREKYLEMARMSMKEKISSPDLLISQTVATISELDRCINVLYEKLAEWYGLYFPELKLSDMRTYCQVVIKFDRKKQNVASILSVVGEKNAEVVVSKAKTSAGADFSDDDLEEVRKLARHVLELYELRDEIEKYQASLARKFYPNLSYLLEPALAAKMVSLAGSLRKLALLPASTIQVMGATKALFKHLKTGSKPPKHGVIFQHPSISGAPRKLRGKIARALASKIAIAARADAFTGAQIGKKLKEEFERRVGEIRGGSRRE
ncbi:MAG: hypothetical protein QXW70_02670 [Candidatus Anstonellales archaeon]